MNTKFLITADSNRSALLKKKIIHYYIANGDATIAELCKEMDLSIPTVTKLVGELLDDGYILDFGKQETNGGRKPNIYGLNPVSGYFVGVDVFRSKINIAAVDFKGDKLRVEENIPYSLENTPEALEMLCNLINDFIDRLSVPREKVLAVGVNISGRVNPVSGYSYSIFYFEEKPLSQILEERIKIKIYIENDTRAMMYGEYMQGVVKGEKNILFINMGWGLGLSMHRKLLERYREGSSTILAEKIEKKEKIKMADMIEAIQKEDVLCIEILEEMGEKLGRGIAGLMNIFNPELVVLGGTLSLTSEYISLPIKSAIRKYSLNLVSQDTEIKVSRLGERAGALGACLLSRSKMLGMIHY